MRRVRLFSSGGYEARWVANGSKFTFRLDDGSVILCDAHGSAEFHQFLNIAKGSVGEVKNMYYIAEDRKYIDKEIVEERRKNCDKEKNRIAKFMKHLKQ